MYLKIVILIVSFEYFLSSEIDKLNEATIKEPSGSYLIKYLTSETKYPVQLTDFSGEPTTKWFKYGSQGYVDELDSFGNLFSFNKTNQGNHLILKSFNKKILDHYETQPFFDDSQLAVDEGFVGNFIFESLENSDLYTVAYLESFEIIEKSLNEDELQISCEANMSMGISLNIQHAQILSEIIDQTVLLNLNMHGSTTRTSKKSSSQQRMKRHQEGGSSSGRKRGNSGGLRKVEKENGLLTRNMAATQYNIQITEGPFILLKSDMSLDKVTCGIKLVDYNKRIAYDKKITKLIRKNPGVNNAIRNKFNYIFVFLLICRCIKEFFE